MHRLLTITAVAMFFMASCGEQPSNEAPWVAYSAEHEVQTTEPAQDDRSAAPASEARSQSPVSADRSSERDDRDEGSTRSTTTVERTTVIRETTITEREVVEDMSIRRAAIFVRNREPKVEGRIGTLQDMMVARLSNHPRLSIISRENVLNAVKAFSDEGPNRGFDVPPEKDLDRILSNSASALRLAQLMGADFVLIVSITSYDAVPRRLSQQHAGDIRMLTETLRLSYEVLDRNRGATVFSDMETVDKRTRLDGIEGDIDNLNELLDEGSRLLAEAFNRRVLPPAPRPGDRVELIVHCSIEDMEIPDVVRNEAGEWVVDRRRFPIALMDVTVEVNGVVEGSAPDTLLVQPGLNKIRLSRAGFRPWEHTVNVRDRMAINAAMQMTDENRRRMREDMALFEKLRIDQKITDGYLEVLQGYAQMLRQSGYKVDIRHDVKIDTDQPPVRQIQSFWAN